MVKILEVQPFEAKIVISKITEALESMKVKRLVIDSVSMFEYSLEDQHRIRKFLFTLFQNLRERNILTIVVSLPIRLYNNNEYTQLLAVRCTWIDLTSY